MKALKIIGIIIVILIALFFVLPLFFAQKAYVEQSVHIKAPAEIVFNQVNNLENWPAWMPFLADDSNARVDFGGQVEDAGATFNWYSKEGDGVLSIEESNPYTFIKNKFSFVGMDPAFSIWEFTETDSGTVATWGFGMENLTYPMGRYFGILLKYNMIPYLKTGLESLKTIAEALPREAEGSIGDILEKTVEVQTVITISDSVMAADFQGFFGRVYPQVSQLSENDTSLLITGAPFAIYHSWNPEGKSLVEAGLPVNKKYKVPPEMSCRELPSFNCVYVSFYGPYELSGMAHDSISNYILKNGYEITGPPMEIYITDPAMEPDPSKWETQVLYPVK